MKKLKAFLLLLLCNTLVFAAGVKIVFTDGAEAIHYSNCYWTDYHKHVGWLWVDQHLKEGELSDDYTLLSDWSNSEVCAPAEEDDYERLKEAIDKTGHWCYYEKHDWVRNPANQNDEYCWWFLRMNKNEIKDIKYLP